MKTVYIVRHAESEGNVGVVLQGMTTTLTDKGHEQAEVVAARCAKLPVDTLISSPMTRARVTADAIALSTNLSVEESDLFKERIRPSSVQGKSPLDPTALVLEASWTLSLFDEGPKVEDGDTFLELKARAVEALAFLEHHASDSILLVGHGYFLKVMFANIILGPEHTGSEFKKLYFSMQTDNTGLSVITMDSKAEHSKWVIRVFNDRSHLGD